MIGYLVENHPIALFMMYMGLAYVFFIALRWHNLAHAKAWKTNPKFTLRMICVMSLFWPATCVWGTVASFIETFKALPDERW